jgi:RimJ/RimL family protein N-acetyltransferase
MEIKNMNSNFLLRDWQMSDAKSLAENANNINVWNYIDDIFPHPYSEKDSEEFITKVLNNEFGVQKAIVVDEQAVGGIGVFLKTGIFRHTAELGYWLGEKYWKRGIMTDAVKEFATCFFTGFPHFQKIYATVFDFNIASQKVLEKAGFEREAILKKGAIKNEKVVDLHYFSLIKEEKTA